MGGWLAGAVVVGGASLGIWAAEAAQAVPAVVGTNPGAVALNPASGPKASSPTWSTTTACPTGFQGSAVFRAVMASGLTFSISPGIASVTAPFHGTLELPLNEIQTVARVPNGGSMEFAVICFSGDSLTGTSHPDMYTFITFSADGKSYTTSASNPGTSGGGASPTPSGSSAHSAGGSLSGSSSSPGGTASPSVNSVSPNPTASASVAPSPTPVDSNFDVTG
jgi:hypothetical protein